jgi:hypothetical protein
MYFVLFFCIILQCFSRYYSMMEACLQGTVTTDSTTLYDLRYFYVDEHRIGHYTCGVAFESMMLVFRKARFSNFCDHAWYLAVQSSENPVVQGFLAEHICLNRIQIRGLQVVHPDLGRMDQASFKTQPDWRNLLWSNKSLCLYVPTDYNFRAVDGVILLLDHKAKIAHLFPLQITLSMRHKESDKDFYSEMWFPWIQPFEHAGITVNSTFVWIDKKEPSTRSQSPLIKELRSGTRIVHPGYNSVHVGIREVDSELASILGL